MTTVERPAADLGRKLREARERKGVTLRQIANTTKIAVAVLDGLERNDISKLPSGIFGRAFVRSFATEVGLDPEASIQEFIAQFRDDLVAVGHPPSDRIEDNEALERRRRIAGTLLVLLSVGVLVAAIVVYFGLAGGRLESLLAARPSPTTLTPAAATAKPLDQPDPSASQPPSQQAAGDSAASLSTGASEPGGPAAPTGDRMVVSLSVTRPCWVSATVDGQKQFERVLRPGDERSLDVRNELALTVGDAGAVTMTINGVQARSLGKSGEVLTARVNASNVKSYLPAQ